MYLSGSSQRGFPPAMWGVPYNNAHSPSLSELARDDEAALADQEEEMQAERERLGNVGPEPPEDEGSEYEDLAEMMLVAAAHLQLFETRRHATKTATRRGSRALIFTFPWGPGAGGAM